METIKLDLIPGKKMPSLHASQYDDGREHGIDLFENGIAYKLDGTETLTINERKGDDCICSLDIENTFADTNHIVFASTEQMCAVWGNNICELVIAKGEKTIGTLNFILEIEQSPTEGGIESESEIKNLKRQIEAITEEVIGDDYYTAEQTDNAIATATEGKADTAYVNTELAKKADKTDTYTKTQVDTALNGKADKDTTYTKTQVDSEISRLDGKIDTKANASDVYTKSQTDTLLNGKANVTDLPDMTQYYDKSEVDDLLDDKADKSDTYTKEQVDDIVYGILPDDTASGSVANFETSLALPLKSLEVDVNAVQSAGTPTPATPLPISGWSEIKTVHTRKNLLDESERTNLVNNIRYYVINGVLLKAGTYTLSISEQVSGLYVKEFITNDTLFVKYNSTFLTFSLAKDTRVWIDLYKTGINTNDTVQLEVGSSATSFEPFNGTIKVIDLGGTYYGGHFTQDKDGHRQLVVTHELKHLKDLNVRYSNNSGAWASWLFFTEDSDKKRAQPIKCSHYEPVTIANVVNLDNYKISAPTWNSYVYWRDDRYTSVNDFVQNAPDITILVDLATPYVIDLPDGQPIITINGTNNIYADTGDCAVEYKVSVEQYVSNHSGGGGAKSLGGVFLGGSNSGSEEEPTEESEEPKEVTKTLGDEPISKK